MPSLSTYFDEIAERRGDDECRAWLNQLFEAKGELATFIASRRPGGGTGTYEGFLKGSFNFSFRYSFEEGPDAIIRFPKPGHTAKTLRDEKVANEVKVIEYLRENTTIPLPRVHSWGLTAESPQGLGPFMIMDYVSGALLSSVLIKPTAGDQEEQVLNADIDNAVLDKIYLQIADYLLQLSQLTFSRIGAISEEQDSPTGWSVTKRPLTYNMNELASVTTYPPDQFPTAPFDRASDYFESVANEHLTHLWTQRNLTDNAEIARNRFIARHKFAQLIPKYCLDNAGFILFCDDMRPANMLVDPETLRITALIDLEFTNAMPAQFTYDPPWWLLLSGPESWLDRGAMDEFVASYEPRMEQFLLALERVEEGLRLPNGGPPLSTHMRESWKTGRFWFNYAARKSFDIDVVYWAAMHHKDGGGSGEQLLDDQSRDEMDLLVETKMEQLKAYKDECSVMFS